MLRIRNPLKPMPVSYAHSVETPWSVHFPELGIVQGNGQTMPIERNNEQIADLIERWVREHVASPAATQAKQ